MHNLSNNEDHLLRYITQNLKTDVRDEFSFKKMIQSLGIIKDDLELALHRLENHGIIKKAALSDYDYVMIELLV